MAMRWYLLLLLVTCPSMTQASQRVTLAWDANTEPDFSKITLYRSAAPCGPPESLSFLADVPKGTTRYEDTTIPDTWAGACYVAEASDTSGNRSGRAAMVSKDLLPPLPPIALTAGPITTTSLTITLPVIDRASVDVRIGAPGEAWDVMSSVCTTSPCVVPNLIPGTTYQLQGRYYRGTATGDDTVFGPVSEGLTLKTEPDVIAPDPPKNFRIRR